MECPKCKYEPTMAEHTASPDICPKCGVVYAKVAARSEAEQARAKPSAAEKISNGLAGARLSMEESRKRRMEREGLAKIKNAMPDHVVVKDIDMPLWSMVQFLVKLALASIPAVLILMLIFYGFGAIISML